MKRILAVIASVRFFVLVGLMELSPLACTLPRLVRRLRRSRATKLTAFAPDVIHLGLAIVIAGGASSHSGSSGATTARSVVASRSTTR
ncbi:MAG: hypothetical protein ACOC7V_01365 [Spirochaetota bacterium]